MVMLMMKMMMNQMLQTMMTMRVSLITLVMTMWMKKNSMMLMMMVKKQMRRRKRTRTMMNVESCQRSCRGYRNRIKTAALIAMRVVSNSTNSLTFMPLLYSCYCCDCSFQHFCNYYR